jgi:hypothetical protein
MNRNTYSGSPAVNAACPNRDRKFPFRHSRRQRVNLQTRPKWATEELCTPSGALRPTNPGRDAFHPRPTSFRRDQINKARTLLRAHKAFSFKSPIAHPPIAHFCQSSALGLFFAADPVPLSAIPATFHVAQSSVLSNPQSAIRNPQSAIRNPQSAIRNPQWFPPFHPRISAIIGNYRLSIFHPKQLKKLTTN